MRTMISLALASLGLAAFLPAQAKTLLFFSRYDSTSIDDKAGELSKARPFDLFMVTPGTGATAAPWVPAAGISAQVEDADNDGKFAEFNGLPQDSWGLGAPFVKWNDKKKGDPRLAYWSIREPITSPPTITVHTTSGPHTVRVGDWVRITENGLAEFFIKREHFVSAAGPQTGNYVEGATCICQDDKGNIFYTPAHAISQSGAVAGGHWVNKPSKIFGYDGAICKIPASAITYDAKGNVTAIAASSAEMIVNEITATVTTRGMVVNSGAFDSIGKNTSITFMMVGLDMDPSGGTFFDQFNNQQPNLIFTFGNPATTCCGGPWGSWVSTIFSTAANGSIAKVNGVTMGRSTLGNADGAWIGIKQGTGNASAPLIRGLAWIEAGFQPTAIYGNTTLETADDGVVSLSGSATAIMDTQHPNVLPSVLLLGAGMAKGGQALSFDLSSLLSGFGSVHVFNLGPFPLLSKVPNLNGQSSASLPIPKDNAFVGLSFVFQSLVIPNYISNPVLIEIRS